MIPNESEFNPIYVSNHIEEKQKKLREEIYLKSLYEAKHASEHILRSFKRCLHNTNIAEVDRKKVAKRCALIHVDEVIKELRKQVPTSYPEFNDVRILTHWKQIKKHLKLL